MSYDYSPLTTKVDGIISRFGERWVITRGTTSVGHIYGVKTLLEDAGTRAGMTLGATKAIELVMQSKPAVKVGDTLTNGDKTYIVSVVVTAAPGSTSVLQKVRVA